MSGSNCCFWTHIHASQQIGKVVWYSHLLKNFPQFVVIHTVKGFSIVNEGKVDIFLKFPCFLYDQWMLAIWSLIPLPFLNPPCTLGSFWFMYCWNLAWRIFEHNLTSMQNECNCMLVWTKKHCPSLGREWKFLFQSYGHCWVFQICWHIECSTLTALFFRILNSSAEIPSVPVTLLIVIFPKAPFTVQDVRL